MQKAAASEAQLRLENSMKRKDGPSVPQMLTDRPKETLLTLEQDESEVISRGTNYV